MPSLAYVCASDGASVWTYGRWRDEETGRRRDEGWFLFMVYTPGRYYKFWRASYDWSACQRITETPSERPPIQLPPQGGKGWLNFQMPFSRVSQLLQFVDNVDDGIDLLIIFAYGRLFM